MVGDKLVSTKFSNSITGGFAAVGEPNVAVCLLPGTEVAFEKEVECEHALGFFTSWMPGKKLEEKVARFRQVKKEQRRKPKHHSITSSARTKSDCGTLRPSALAS
jgi:hypothetical protein